MSKPSKTTSRKPPSRVRYEQSHPTISCRVSLKTYAMLDKARQEEEWSFADMLKAGLGVLKADTKMQREAYRQGYREAEIRFKITYPCCVCRNPIAIESQQAKQSAAQYMREHRWAHNECLQTRGHASPQ